MKTTVQSYSVVPWCNVVIIIVNIFLDSYYLFKILNDNTTYLQQQQFLNNIEFKSTPTHISISTNSRKDDFVVSLLKVIHVWFKLLYRATDNRCCLTF